MTMAAGGVAGTGATDVGEKAFGLATTVGDQRDCAWRRPKNGGDLKFQGELFRRGKGDVVTGF